MRDIIKIRLKRRIATRRSKENWPLNIKTDAKWPILKLRLPNLRFSFYFILLLVVFLLFKRIYITYICLLTIVALTLKVPIPTGCYRCRALVTSTLPSLT